MWKGIDIYRCVTCLYFYTNLLYFCVLCVITMVVCICVLLSSVFFVYVHNICERVCLHACFYVCLYVYL